MDKSFTLKLIKDLESGFLPEIVDLGLGDVGLLSLSEVHMVLDWRSVLPPIGLFGSVFTLHSNLKVINRELSFNY
jgi:hypothetical protein